MHDLLKSETSPDSRRRAADGHRRGRGKAPVLVKVLAAVAGVGLLLLGVLGSPDRPLGRSPDVVGEREMVRVSGPNGKTAEVLALIDTGASASSLDTALAKDLGFDLAAAPRITVGSALGREKRPVVDTTVRLAGRSFAAKVSVNSRAKREPPVLLGRQEVQGLHVAVGKRLLTQPESTAAPSALRILFAKAPAIDPVSMMALLPLAALLIVVLRVVVGLNTLGTFSPVLLALACSGPPRGRRPSAPRPGPCWCRRPTSRPAPVARHPASVRAQSIMLSAKRAGTPQRSMNLYSSGWSCDFMTAWASIEQGLSCRRFLAPHSAPRSVLLRFAWLSLAPSKLAPLKFAPPTFTLFRNAPLKSAPVQSAPSRAAPVKSARSNTVPLKRAPIRSETASVDPVKSASARSASLNWV